MKPKAYIFAGLAIVCGLGASYMTSRLLAERTQEEPERVDILVAKRTINVGERVTKPEDMFELKAVLKENEPPDAIKDFDAVLEQYPKGSKTAESFYYKGMSLVKTGRSRDARKEFTSVISQYPRTEVADKARSQMKALGFNTPAKGKK